MRTVVVSEQTLCVATSRAPTQSVFSYTSTASSSLETGEVTMLNNERCNDTILMSSVLSVLDDDDGVDQILEDVVAMLASYLDTRAGVVGRPWVYLKMTLDGSLISRPGRNFLPRRAGRRTSKSAKMSTIKF